MFCFVPDQHLRTCSNRCTGSCNRPTSDWATKLSVFPEWVRQLVRVTSVSTGNYDHQYGGRQDIYLVTDVDLAESSWKDPPDKRRFCSLDMPSTP